MCKENDTIFITKLYYSDENTDITSELTRAIMLFIEREVQKLCVKQS